jgi:hypothetical protein
MLSCHSDSLKSDNLLAGRGGPVRPALFAAGNGRPAAATAHCTASAQCPIQISDYGLIAVVSLKQLKTGLNGDPDYVSDVRRMQLIKQQRSMHFYRLFA